MLNITQNDYNIIKQRINERYIKINILDFQYRTVDQISGNALSCSVQCDADSDLRRSCSVSLVVRDNSFDVQSGGKIWLDKYIQIYVGLKNIYTQEIQWYNQGVYLIDAPSWTYDATTNTLSFSGLDLMSKLTGARNGQLQGIPTVIKQGENVREAIIATLTLGGFTKYVVSECINRDGSVQAVPYDIEIDQGGYVYDILSKLRDILPQYQIYFDVDGVFHYDLIPTGDDEPVMLTDDVWDSILVRESINTDFTSVKNLVEVYGYTHDPEYYPSDIHTPIVLPDEYTQLEYIESTGTQYIITGLNSLINYDQEITFSDYSYALNAGILGSENYYNSYTGYNNTLRWCMSDRCYDTTGSLTEKRNVKLGLNYLVVDDVSISQTSDKNTAPSSTTHTLFKGHNCASVKIYAYRASLNGELLRNFIPCKRNSDSAIGMYDLVSGTFFGNSGTGSFIAGETVEATSSVITMTIANLSALNENDVIGFTTPFAVNGDIQLSVNSFGAKNLVDSNGDFVTSLDADTYYVAMYQANDTWKFLGHQQAQATWSDMNPDSPFYVNGPVGIIRQVLCGGEYENIQSDELALERAKVEIYWKCRLNDSITLNIVPIPWLDVNLVVSHAPKDSTDEKRYIIKSYSVDYGKVDATMNVSMISYYGYYPMY